MGTYYTVTLGDGSQWVTAQIGLAWSAQSGGSGNAEIGGLPFNSTNATFNGAAYFSEYAIMNYAGITLTTNYTELGVQLGSNSNVLAFVQVGSAQTVANVAITSFSAGGQAYGTVTYRVK